VAADDRSKASRRANAAFPSGSMDMSGDGSRKQGTNLDGKQSSLTPFRRLLEVQ
jgi:hypothetical protein